MFLQEQSSARSRALLCTQTTLSVLLVLFVFSLAIKAIFIFKLTITLYDKHQMYSTLNHQIYPVTVRMKILGKSDSQRKNKHKACRYFVYIQHALLYLLCLPLFPCSKLPDACRENDILIKSSWYPSNVLMIICKFWYSRKLLHVNAVSSTFNLRCGALSHVT